MSTKDFHGKVCWITGASSAIGAALAVALNNIGAHLIISARNIENLVLVKERCRTPENVVTMACDMENTGMLADICIRSWNTFHRIDYVFLNAGFAVRDLIIDTDLELVKKVLSVNFLSNVAIAKALLPLMKKRGSGCFAITSSLSGKYGIPRLAAYSASKHALHGFFESLRAEHGNDGIQVTILIPGLVKTDISINALKGDGNAYGRMQESIATGISPEWCAIQMIRAVARGRNEALIGGPEVYSVIVKRLFPGFFSFAIRNNPVKKLRRLGIFQKSAPHKN